MPRCRDWSAKSGAGTRWAPFTDPAAPGSLAYLPASRSGQAGGVVGGGQFGYNFQANPYFVLGAEADMHGTGVRSGGGSGPTLYPSPFTAGGVLVPLGPYGRGTALNWFGTVRGRAGFLATPTLLIYGTGGFAYGGVSAGGYNATRTGWTAGGGAEWAFHPNWSAKLEYKYVDLSGGNDGSFGYGHRRQSQYNVVTAGVNYRFNFAGPAPVAARY